MSDLRAIVFEALNSAKDNGWDYSKCDVDVVLVANDMICYCADLEDVDDSKMIVPHIEAWIEENK